MMAGCFTAAGCHDDDVIILPPRGAPPGDVIVTSGSVGRWTVISTLTCSSQIIDYQLSPRSISSRVNAI